MHSGAAATPVSSWEALEKCLLFVCYRSVFLCFCLCVFIFYLSLFISLFLFVSFFPSLSLSLFLYLYFYFSLCFLIYLNFYFFPCFFLSCFLPPSLPLPPSLSLSLSFSLSQYLSRDRFKRWGSCFSTRYPLFEGSIKYVPPTHRTIWKLTLQI